MLDLTELDIRMMDLYTPNVAELLFLTNIKSLRLFDAAMQITISSSADVIRCLTGLTKLDSNSLFHVASLRCFTRLVTLRVGIADDGSRGPKCPPIGLELLEELDLSVYRRLPSGLLSGLARLKRLRLFVAYHNLDEDFFNTLAGLGRLTHLAFIEKSWMAPPLEFFTQFNRLSSLRTLTIHVHERLRGHVPSPCAFLFEGSFPLLRSLHFKGYAISANDRCELMRRFHCLNTVERL